MTPETRRRPHLLLVDDLPANLTPLAGSLGRDHRITLATSGAEALALAAREAPDLILLDLMMPGMDGYEVCRRLKADPATADIPVIFITVMDDELDETRGLDMGAVDYITKPVSLPIVAARVRTHLHLKAAREQIQEQYRQLQQINHLREEVDRIMRHDLKSPVNGILALIAVAREEVAEQPEMLEILDLVYASAQSLREMIDRSVRLFRMEQGTYPLEPTRVDLLPLCAALLAEHRSRLEDKQAVVLLRIDGEPCRSDAPGTVFEVWGETALCRSIFENLLVNAIEALPSGGHITLDLDHGPRAVISLHNDGAVPEEIRSRFFEKYVTAGKRHGTGLGTYSARLMVRTQGGTIGMHSSAAAGTTLTITLPRPTAAPGPGLTSPST